MDLLKAGLKSEEMQAKQEAEGLRAGIDVAKTQEQMKMQQMQQMQKPKGE
jgi:hypothetical protein